MYGGGFDSGGGDQFGGGGYGDQFGGAFGGGGASQFGHDQFGGGGGQFGGGGGVAPGGGFMPQVDNSTPDGKAKGEKNRQSLVPVTIKQLKNAPPQPAGESGFTLDGRDLHQVTIVGLIMSADEQTTAVQFMVDDGTDTIMVKQWIDADQDDALAERRAQYKEGVIVRVIGQLRSFNNTKSIVAYDINPLTDFNEYTFHFIEAVHTHLRHTKGPPPVPSGAGTSYGGGGAVGAAASMMGGGAPAYGAPAYGAPAYGAPSFGAPAGGASIEDLVLTFFRTKGDENDVGCTIAQAAEALNANGVTGDQVRQYVDNLVQDGHLYSTIDDDHYKATS